MFWLGKLLGSLFGYMIAGPFGAVFGLILGHYFDLARKGHWFFFPHHNQHTHTQDIFFQATFTIMGFIAKADGRVSENEIRVATNIMQNMMLTPALKQQAINFFRQGKQAEFDIDAMLTVLKNACFQQRDLLHLFLEIQMRAANADGGIPRNKQRIIEYICYRLGLNIHDFFQRSYSYYGAGTNYRSQQGSSAGGAYRGQQYQRYQQKDSLSDAYRILGVAASINDADLKKAYRRMMSKNHPDKLVSKGLPEEMIKLATQKTQEIKSAYETICKSRGIK